MGPDGILIIRPTPEIQNRFVGGHGDFFIPALIPNFSPSIAEIETYLHLKRD